MMTEPVTGYMWIDYILRPRDVMQAWVYGSLLAFIVVQVFKSYRRNQRIRHPKRKVTPLTRFDMFVMTFLLAFFDNLYALIYVNPYPPKIATFYALEGGVFAVVIITAGLWVIGKIAPDLRAKLSQDRRCCKDPTVGPCRREHDLDDTKEFF